LSRLASTPDPKAAVCASAGNLGQALAYSGRTRGIGVTVVAATSANPAKIDRIRRLGAAVELVEGDIEEARQRAREIAASDNALLVEDSENLDTCEGAATIGLELIEGCDRIDTILLALGGGALATGVGHVFKSLSPTTEVVCIQPSGAPALALSWRARTVVTTDRTDTIADGVAGRFPIAAVLQDLLAVADHVPLVEEASIKPPMNEIEQAALQILQTMLFENHSVSVSLSAWRKAVMSPEGPLKGQTGDARKKNWQRARKSLETKGIVETSSKEVWLKHG